jgi:hypothetical protein
MKPLQRWIWEAWELCYTASFAAGERMILLSLLLYETKMLLSNEKRLGKGSYFQGFQQKKSNQMEGGVGMKKSGGIPWSLSMSLKHWEGTDQLLFCIFNLVQL